MVIIWYVILIGEKLTLEGDYDILLVRYVLNFYGKRWADTFLMVPTIKDMSRWCSQETLLAYKVSVDRLIRSKPVSKPVI